VVHITENIVKMQNSLTYLS